MDTDVNQVVTSLEAFGCGKRLSLATSVVDPEPGDSYMGEKQDDARVSLQRIRAETVVTADKVREIIDANSKHLAHLEENIRRIDAALAVLGQPSENLKPFSDRRLTIKQGVLHVLKRVAPQGLTANEILARLRTELGMDYERTSLSPQLSRLGAAREIRLEQGRWFLATKENGSEA